MSQQEAKAKFIERYGRMGRHLDRKVWLGWLGIYLAGWTDAQKQECPLCGEPIARELITCQTCHFGEEKDRE